MLVTKLKREREGGRSYGLRSLEKWTLEQVPTRARSQLPFDLFQAVLRSIPNSLFLFKIKSKKRKLKKKEKEKESIPNAKKKKKKKRIYRRRTIGGHEG